MTISLFTGCIVYHKGVTRLREDDVGYLVEILASYSGKWREIGVQLGFTPNELDSLPFSPKPANSLTYMLNEWTQWAVGGSHSKFATLEDLEKALQSRIVNLGVVATELRGKWLQAKGQSRSYMLYIYYVHPMCTCVQMG